MKARLVFLLLFAGATSASAQTSASSPTLADVPDTLTDAVAAGYQITAAVGQGPANQDHVVYLVKGTKVIVCGFRFVLTDKGFDTERSKTLGLCTDFK